jgi:alginate O-acetyltransferase complex protein AlgI
MIGWVFFSLENFSDAINYIKTLFSFDLKGSNVVISKEFVFTLVFAAILSFVGLNRIGKQLQGFIYKEFKYTIFQAFAALMVAIVLYGISASYITATGFNPFIYFRF